MKEHKHLGQKEPKRIGARAKPCTLQNVSWVLGTAALCFHVLEQEGGRLWTFPQLNARTHAPLLQLPRNTHCYFQQGCKDTCRFKDECKQKCVFTLPVTTVLTAFRFCYRLHDLWPVWCSSISCVRGLCGPQAAWFPGKDFQTREGQAHSTTRTWMQCWDPKQAVLMLWKPAGQSPEQELQLQG